METTSKIITGLELPRQEKKKGGMLVFLTSFSPIARIYDYNRHGGTTGLIKDYGIWWTRSSRKLLYFH